LFLVTGGVWFLQGIGLLRGSFMSDTARWTVIGAVVAVCRIALFAWELAVRRRRS
jgi:hypothetical protein